LVVRRRCRSTTRQRPLDGNWPGKGGDGSTPGHPSPASQSAKAQPRYTLHLPQPPLSPPPMALTPDAPAESAGTRSHLWTSGPQGSSHYSLVLERLAIEMLGPDRCMASGLVRGWRSAKGKTLVLVWRAVQSVLRLYRRGTFRVEAHPTTTFSCTLPAVRVPGCLPSGRVPEELGGPIRALLAWLSQAQQ